MIFLVLYTQVGAMKSSAFNLSFLSLTLQAITITLDLSRTSSDILTPE